MYRPLPPKMFLASAAAVLLHVLAPAGRLVPAPCNWLGIAPLVAGLWLCVAGSRHFDRERTNINTFRPPDVLVTDGLFAFSRNPMYLGFVIALAGIALLLGSISPWAAPVAFFALAAGWYIPFEERACGAQFGAAYEAYCARTRRWV
jgi:protein-S-isoprenylcysteine O-methyltransferase Ste14